MHRHPDHHGPTAVVRIKEALNLKRIKDRLDYVHNTDRRDYYKVYNRSRRGQRIVCNR